MAEQKVFIRLNVTWHPSTPLHLGAGSGGGFVDRRVVRRADGRPYVPGSAVKGKVRYYAQALFRAKEGPTCQWQDTRESWEDREPGPGGCGCHLCALFGAPGFAPGALVFTDLLPTDGEARVLLRSSTALDRARRVALDGRLFSLEAAGGNGLAFAGLVQGWLPASRLDQLAGLLYAALRLVPQLGGSRSRGLGWGEMRIELDGALREQEDQMKGWVAAWI